jgi:hypothetical protein
LIASETYVGGGRELYVNKKSAWEASLLMQKRFTRCHRLGNFGKATTDEGKPRAPTFLNTEQLSYNLELFTITSPHFNATTA